MKSLSISQLKPMPGFVLVEPAQSEQKTASGIILTETKEEKPQYGKVLACGELVCSEDQASGSCCSEDKKPCDMKLKKNDQVVYKKWGGNEVMIDDVEYQFLKYEDILAIVK